MRSGILSIIAVKLGALCATAIDIDDVARKVTIENSKLNNVEEKVGAFKAELKEVEKKKYDLMVANIIANVVIDISKIVPDYLKVGGYLITSGIIRERREEVIEAYTKLGFTVESGLELGEWVAIVFKCQNSL